MRLSDIDILSIGNLIQLAGVVYVGDGKAYLCMFPDEAASISGGASIQTDGEEMELESVVMDGEDWKKFLRQTDLLETESLTRQADGSLYKAIVRKSQRQIDQGVSWNVFRRDGYACRYCGKNDVPLTVDHLVLWEDGGPSVEENLVSACRKCNKTRGRTPYGAWLQHQYYVKVSRVLSPEMKKANEDLLPTLSSVERRMNVHSR